MRSRWHWLLFAALLLLELWYFQHTVSRNVAWIYPRWNDQIQYLTESYTGYEYLRGHGFWTGIVQALGKPSAQGTLHDVAAILVFCLAGPSRSAALAVNLLAFLAWQVATFATWKRLTGRWSGAWIGAGLLLALNVLVDTGPGSPVDFRLDWMACCAVGVALSAGLLSDGFRDTRWSAVFGVLIGVAVLVRFLTIVYFGVTLVLLLAGFAACWLVARPAGTGARLGRVILAAALASAVCLPLLWRNRDWVINYYWIGHLTGPESALRSPNFGIVRSVGFILRESLWSHHLGTTFGWIAGCVVAALALLAWMTPKPAAVPGSGRLGSLWGLGGLAFAVPALVLVLHSQKSPFVVSVLLPGLMALLLALLLPLFRRIPTGGGWRAWAPACVAIAVWILGGIHFVRGLGAPGGSADFLAGAREVNALADYFFQESKAAGLTAPRLAVDQVTDSLDAQIMRVICYERQHAWMPFMMTLPTGITEEKEEVVWDRLKSSDFVLLTTEMGGNGYWPFDHEMRRLHPQFQEWCEGHLQKVRTFPLFGRTMALYRRPHPAQP